MAKDLVNSRIGSTTLIVVCVVVSAGLTGYFLDLYKVSGVSANKAPTADAGEGPLVGYPGVEVTFNGSASGDTDGAIVSYDWDFGDGYTGIGIKPSHSYDDAGNYTATLKVTDSDGATGSDTIGVSVREDFDGTGIYTLVTVDDIMKNGTALYGTLLRVMNATVTDDGSFGNGYGSDPSGWVKFSIGDSTTNAWLDVYCEGGASRPLSLVSGDMVNVFGKLDEYSGDWEIIVRTGTLDRTVIIPPVYQTRTVAELTGDPAGHLNEFVRVEDATVATASAYIWSVGDATTDSTVKVYSEIGANVSTWVNVSDEVLIQGVFTYYDYDQDGADADEWEIKVRAAGEDYVLRTGEYDHPPVISSIWHTPAAPSAYDSVYVNATIEDNVAVSSAEVIYSVDGGAEAAAPMSLANGSIYSGVVPPQDAGSNVSYRARATDNAGQSSESEPGYYVTVDSPPAIAELYHRPRGVRPDTLVNVTANVTDDGGIASVVLNYAVNGSANLTQLTMLDDGAAPDASAGDWSYVVGFGYLFPEDTRVVYYVVVEDTAGQRTTSANVSFISSYDQEPQFGGVYRHPEMPGANEEVKVVANVTDDFILTWVNLTYDAGSGWQVVNMTKRADGNYEGVIPGQPKLATVRYYVNATDNKTHVVQEPAVPQDYLSGNGVPIILYATGHGEYAGGFDYFASVVADKGFSFVEDDINDIDLSWVEFVIISDPETQYTAAELSALKSYVEGGGGLLVLSETDYDEYGRPENCNPILANLGIGGRFNDDGFQDEWYCWDYPSYANYAEYIPYFNFRHSGPNGSYVAGDYDDWGCFDLDTTGITSGFPAAKYWFEGASVSSIYNTSEDIVVIRGTDMAYNKDNDIGGDNVNEAYYFPYPKFGQSGHVQPPVLAANDSIGTGRVVYGGLSRTLGDGNYYGWSQSNITELSGNIIDWLVNVPMGQGPKVSDVSCTPGTPAPSQAVAVKATVAGVGPAISSVTLRYAVNGSYYVSKPMTLSSGVWSATIPRQGAGSAVTYYVQAVDSAGSYGYWPTEPVTGGIGWYVVSGTGHHIVLSEICYNPPGTDGDFEFVELYNPLPAALDIGGWWISAWDGKYNSTEDSDGLPRGAMIPAFGFYLMAKEEYDGWGADWIIEPTDWNMGNNYDDSGVNHFGDALFLYNSDDAIVDKVCWDDANYAGQNASAYEGEPFIETDPGDMGGSIERLPGLTDHFAGNWQDTNNNNDDFVFRKFVEAQGTSSPVECPPWAASVASPIPLPDGHPSVTASSVWPSAHEGMLSVPEPTTDVVASPVIDGPAANIVADVELDGEAMPRIAISKASPSEAPWAVAATSPQVSAKRGRDGDE